jgi:nucleoside 2-deoxyribosyltransferase
LERCDRLFAILDGLDAGTIFEIGYARKLGIPVYAYAETVSSEDCKMFTGSGCKLFDDYVTAIYATAWKI